MAKVDPTIEAVFGPAPKGLDLTASTRTGYNIVSCAGLGLSTAAVATRFYIRTIHQSQKQNLGVDDYTVLLGLLCNGALVATALLAGQYGSGTHIWSNDIDQLTTTLKVVFAEPWVFAASVTSTKVSILLLYRRLFYISKLVSDDRTFVIMFWTATTLTCTFPIIMWTVMACACRPLSFYWRQYAGDTDGSCIDVLGFYLIIGIINMINDIIILTVPIPRILRLHMNAKKKASVAGIMLLGSFVCVASIIRICYLKQLTTGSDITWILEPAFAWSNLEPSVAIISACLPTFGPLFYSLRNKRIASSNKDKASGGASQLHSGHIRLQDYGQRDLDFAHGQSRFRIEDEEPLTDGAAWRTHSRKTASRDSQSIAVKTQIDVVTTDVGGRCD